MLSQTARGAALGLSAAALFGASAPLAKLLLPDAGVLALSALLYLGAGLALAAARAVRAAGREAPLRRADLPALGGSIAFGGVLGPWLLLAGLARTSALAGSLALNLEAPLTMLLAVAVFGEHLEKREAGAAALVVLGAAALGLRPGDLHAGPGALAIALACGCWAVDNNLAQRLSLRDPRAVVMWKCLGAGGCSAALALGAGQALPRGAVVLPALALGAASYGLSLVLHQRALRLVGAARQAAYFATAPFLGAALAVPLLGDRPTALDAAAAGLMIAGVALLQRARHAHLHTHDAIDHDHAHVHDEHHAHAHAGQTAEPHAHPHRHEELTHEHAHSSDAHHRHEH